MNYRVGIGHDVHRLVTGRRLVLGGVQIPYSYGLLGHSDADVVLHAVCDAILGAAGMGDIGEHFPNTDPQYKDVASTVLLKHVHQKIQQAGWAIENVDVMILAQEPKLQAFKPKMRYHIAFELSIAETQVNIKAGTNEGLGFIGAKEGIAAYAVVLLTRA